MKFFSAKKSPNTERVIGTRVNDRTGRRVGRIDDVVVDSRSTDILFAVVGFGGFRGKPETYFPIPWKSLTYDDRKAAYVGFFPLKYLEAAPAGWDDH